MKISPHIFIEWGLEFRRGIETPRELGAPLAESRERRRSNELQRGGGRALTRGLARTTGGDGTAAAAQQEEQLIFFPPWRGRDESTARVGEGVLSLSPRHWEAGTEAGAQPIGRRATMTTKGMPPPERRGREARTTQIAAVRCVHVVVRPRGHD